MRALQAAAIGMAIITAGWLFDWLVVAARL